MDNMWKSGKFMWITFQNFSLNVEMWKSAVFFPQVFHIAQARYRLHLSELSTFPHIPTTVTKFKFKISNSSTLNVLGQ